MNAAVETLVPPCPDTTCSDPVHDHGQGPVSCGHEAALTEQAKYEKMWAFEQYRAVAPGESVAQIFLAQARPKPGSTVIDFGTGTGRGALMLAIMGDCRVEMLDFAANCLDVDVRNALATQSHMLRFTQHDLTKPVPISAAYGYCTDVMEHIPPDDVDRVLQNILLSAQHVFFQISCVDDVCGALIGAPLHLSVHPHDWWLKRLQALECVVHWSEDCGSHCMFYVTAWQKGQEFVNRGVLNVEDQRVRDNVATNIKGDWMQVSPHVTNDVDVMILCGGPSLADHVDTIKQLRAEGVKLVTLNGTYNWALEHDMLPSCQIIVDAREFNKRFVSPVAGPNPERNFTGCIYLMASQVDPAVLVGLPEDKTYLWHTTAEEHREVLNARYERWYGIPGGSTVALRAIPMLRQLGYRRFHMFGWDSCLQPKYGIKDRTTGKLVTVTLFNEPQQLVYETRAAAESVVATYAEDGGVKAEVVEVYSHHAYPQPENDAALVCPVVCGERIFHAHPWMISQAQETQDLIRFLGEEIELEVYGDGLIAYMLKTGARLQDEKEEFEEAHKVPPIALS